MANRPTFNSADHPVKVSVFVLVLCLVALLGFINPAMVSNAESETYLPRQLRTTEREIEVQADRRGRSQFLQALCLVRPIIESDQSAGGGQSTLMTQVRNGAADAGG